MKVVMPAQGEFGLVLRYHVPAFHALPAPKMAVIETGMEALYPSADQYHVLDRVHDDQRRGMLAKGTDQTGMRRMLRRAYPDSRVVELRKRMPEARFVPEPYVVQDVPEAEVVVCPRRRNYGADKNWPHWAELTERLTEVTTVFAAGAPDSSASVPCPKAWEYDRFLDASIQAMRSARLVIATDAGLAHLAVLCGRPLLLITYNGKVAPGAVRDPRGRVMEPEYWLVRLDEYYHAANHTGAPIIPFDGWEHPGEVVRQVKTILKRGRAA